MVGRAIDPYVEFSGYPRADVARQTTGAGGGLPARGGLRLLPSMGEATDSHDDTAARGREIAMKGGDDEGGHG